MVKILMPSKNANLCNTSLGNGGKICESNFMLNYRFLIAELKTNGTN